MHAVAAVLDSQGHHVEAEKREREVLDIRRRILGLEHPQTLESMYVMAQIFGEEGHYAEAEKLYRETLDIQRRVLGPEHRQTLSSMRDLGDTLHYEGHYAEAEKLDRETLDIQRRVLGPEHPDTLNTLENLATVLSSERRYDEAAKLFRQAIEMANKAQGQLVLSTAWYNYACGAAVAGHRDDAFQYLREAIDNGYSDVEGMTIDDNLKSLRSDPRFDALVAHAKERAAAAQKKQ
jgi:eukaryotic-like serine/threonine-protein kinase